MNNPKVRQSENNQFALRQVLVRGWRRLSLRQVFFLPFAVQFVIATAIISFVLLHGGQLSVNFVVDELRRQTLERVHEQLDSRLREPMSLNRLQAEAWHNGQLDLQQPSVRNRYFVSLLRSFPEVNMTFVGLPDGSFYGARRIDDGQIQAVSNDRMTGGSSWFYSVSGQGDAVEWKEQYVQLDARTRPWFEAAAGAGHPVFSGIYRGVLSREPIIAAVYPLYDQAGTLQAVFAANYTLSWLEVLLDKLAIGPAGQVFVTDEDGRLVAASVMAETFFVQHGKIERIQAINADNLVLRTAARTLAARREAAAVEFDLEGRHYLVNMAPFQEYGLNWKTYVVLDSGVFLAGINQALGYTVLIIFLAMLIFLALSAWTSRWITRPILRLNDASRELAAGRYQPVPDDDRQDELGQLSRSFNRTARQLTELVGQLEARVAERTRDLELRTETEQVMRQRLFAELSKAGKVQRGLLPEPVEEKRLSIQPIYEPCMLVSGDSYDYQWCGEGVLRGYLIDVMGHGAATALQTAAIQVMIREITAAGMSLEEGIRTLNQRVGRYLDEDLLVAAFFFELDFTAWELRYAAAGITEFYLAAASGQGRIITEGMFLGISEQPDFEVKSRPVQPGDRFCFYTDGIAEVLTENFLLPKGEPFEVFCGHFRELAEAGVQRDDVTAVCLEVKG
ncbi:SpoIIE family protein phosphatase [Propionispora hippei]|uniref:Serine phosphatase RsbU, regulator of sigma subunit n=1 Tax=Propionispora hippei DSM 15287 TaxID=1123003 RepID=A0A1M6IU59_9FIRM|nr:SpoIIE family protein phosphatase [Propionispora hippei]SHJ37978.1 Serine phosphatase RsbU, regulator of sigma subunit [Propionispora hippei DSM 15287]